MQLIDFDEWPPALDVDKNPMLYEYERTNTNHITYSCYCLVALLPDTKPCCICRSCGSEMCLTIYGMNYLLKFHLRGFGILVFWGEIFMEPELASTDGHLTVLLRLCIFCEEMKGNHMHKGVGFSAR